MWHSDLRGRPIEPPDQDRQNSSIQTGGPYRQRRSHDLQPSCFGARHRRGGGHRPRAGPCPAADEVSDQHPQGQAGLRALRSAQRRRQFPAGAALSSTARAVPERCGGVVWRRPRPRESHAHESYQPYKPNKPRDTNESDQPCDPTGACESYDSGGSGQYTLRASVLAPVETGRPLLSFRTLALVSDRSSI
jgi:hypothetical protein